jgi:hypothetical protein
MPIDHRSWTRETLERHSVDMRQFIDFRQSTLPNGSRIVEAYNGSGLTLSILPDRGLDIWAAHYNGIPLTWISQGSPHAPDFGQTWLQQFNGGLLTTCGLTHVGPPEKDEISGELRDIHGRYSRLRAGHVNVEELGWLNGHYDLDLSGTVSEGSLFGYQLKLKRNYSMTLGVPAIGWADQIINVGDVPAPLMFLYHINPGFPLVSEGAELHTAHTAVYPRDAAAKVGVKRWSQYDAASAAYPEQVFFHHPLKVEQMAQAFIGHEDFGLRITWNADQMPYFNQWKNTRQGVYVCGIEPSNSIPEGQNAARRNNRLPMLQPGEMVSFYTKIDILDGTEAVTAAKNDLDAIRQSGTPAENCNLDDYAQFAQQE